MNQKCKDPCPGLCGIDAECRVVSHSPICICLPGLIGDPFTKCTLPQAPVVEQTKPCTPNPCGSNAMCREQNGIGACQCIPDYYGNPYEGCRPECILNSDCASNRACLQNKCQDPCPGSCAQNAFCQAINHIASCTCQPGYTGNPFSTCQIETLPRKLLQALVKEIPQFSF